MLDKRKFYIDGCWVQPHTARDIEVIDPSCEEVCGLVSGAGKEDTNLAVAAAEQAFKTWRHTTKSERLSFLATLLQIYERRLEEMAEIISLEMGSPIDFSLREQAPAGVTHIKDTIDVLKDFQFERHLTCDTPNDYLLYEPIGVAALITPWNKPISQVALKVLPAIAAGCTCVLKPSEVAPFSSMLFAEMLDEAGLPKGVFNLVNGYGVDTGRLLSAHRDVDMVSFTGSTKTGREITQNAAHTIKRVCLELGGKGANVIFADADKDAIKRGVMRCFENTGQSCNAPSRMLVEGSVYKRACAQAKEIASAVAVGYASDHGDHLGPVVSEEQYERVQSFIQKGIDEGATLLTGGIGKVAGLEKGYFIKPTVFADVDTSMTIAREEIFGPVLSMLSFDSEEQAIAMANDTYYGLTNYVQTADLRKAERFARASRSGMVAINGHKRARGTPFGGFKQSGNGRERGVFGFTEFLEVKAISGWNKKAF